ncbi:hypothetical protein VFC49_04155 [Thermococcus sp. SY098]|uniref:hypothetical protein n=1 Tax=Thermococcus sp. SY098 TaxID=3111325 RepID=UPI002D77176E|nr:hypothetical protein [Thermococcus sp. SY098]WRS53315.1 hypothetical protein VFC49_04155 [Thermococcus sp. SY098]
MDKKNNSKTQDILLVFVLIIFCGVIIVLGTGTWNYPYWLVGVLIGGAILVLSLAESDWKIQDWYTFVISGVTISLIILISYWIGRSANPEKSTSPDASNIILGLSAMATVLMVFYVALQTHATKQSLEEMKKQRLTPIVVNALGILHSIKDKLEKNFELIDKGVVNSKYPEDLLEIKEEIERPELFVVDSLLGLELYRDLEDYQENVEKLKKYSKNLKTLIEDIGETKLMSIFEEVQKETGIEINKTEGNAVVNGEGSVVLPEGSGGDIYAIILGLAREMAYGNKDAEKLYWTFRGLLRSSNDEKMKELGEWYLQELWGVMLALVLTPEEDAKDKRDKRVKKIEFAIKQLEEEYIK